ncbi:MAG TPA: LysR family transcriptional regulator [Telmatospirillum sp.]|nr:LysR family transcriptional regulator [Telmatospirillum sp.]
MDWETLKYFLAVAREGTLAGAGRSLSVKHSTVLRRIAQLEEALGLKLFDRHPNGYMLTAIGREMLEPLVRIDEDLVVLERRLSGQDLRLTGTVKVSTVGVLVPWIADSLIEFRALYPGIRVEIAISPTAVSLARHEADISIRVSRTPPESLVGRRIATLRHGIYAARTHAAAEELAPDPVHHDWIGYSDGRGDLSQAEWMAAHVPHDRVVLRTNHTGMLVAAVKAGLGLGVLPCYLGDVEPNLRRLQTIEGLGQEMWILTHADLKRTPRIRVLMDHLARELSRRRDLIEGRLIDETGD